MLFEFKGLKDLPPGGGALRICRTPRARLIGPLPSPLLSTLFGPATPVTRPDVTGTLRVGAAYQRRHRPAVGRHRSAVERYGLLNSEYREAR